ncbi:MAG: DUF485 domain-containing protein [Pseudonocardia sp.]|nr:DUF485 domain-containing protein [Pseudonocardia sp.]
MDTSHHDPGATRTPDAAAIARTPAFRALVRSRARFAVPAAILGFGAYLLVMILSGFTTVLNGPALGALSWTAVLTVLIFPLVWLLAELYRRRAAEWDTLAEQAVAEAGSTKVRTS